MLELKNVCKSFNIGTSGEKKVLDNLSFKIDKGDFVTVIGGNGSGKSTTMNVISGTSFIDSGAIILDGEDISNQSEHIRAKNIGRVFQDPMKGTCGDMRIFENMALANRRGKFRGLKWGVSKEELKKFKELLTPLGLGLESRLEAKVKLLSGGQRQALTLIMATLIKPKLLLLDEHTAALDPKTASKVLIKTEYIVKKNNLTTLMITHNMRDAIKYGNRLIMLDRGKVIFDVRDEEKANLNPEYLVEKFDMGLENL